MQADNSHHLIEAAQRRHTDAYRRVEDAVRDAYDTGEPLTITALSTRAGVSRAFIYAHPDLVDAAHQIQPTAGQRQQIPARQRASQASLLRRIEVLTQRNKDLRNENHDLRNRLESVYGRLRDREMIGTVRTTPPLDPDLDSEPSRREEEN